MLAKCDPSRQQTLVTEAEVDPMEGEQTWPTEEELREADEAAALLKDEEDEKPVKKIPKGMSDYQAAWILDDENEGEEGDCYCTSAFKSLEEIISTGVTRKHTC